MWILVLATLAIGDPARIVASHSGHRLVLTMGMIRAIDSWDPTFRPWQDRDYQPGVIRSYRFSESQAPFAVLGDYNGDGRADAAIDGRTKTHGVSLVLLSEKETYRIVVLDKSPGPPDPKKEWYGVGDDRREYGWWAFLGGRLPAGVELGMGDGAMTPRYECFERDYWQKGSVALCWTGSRFREVITGD